ncbi:NEDD8-conjugating enzyme [Hortaea werneckii]|nr:NEDD8-conjugating enzyme [Hortaea werneckii]
MLKIWSMKQQQQKNEAASGQSKKKKVTAAQLRVQKDLSELALPATMSTHFPNPDDILNFTLTLQPDEGLYKSGLFTFTFTISQSFPHEPPKVKCKEKIYHPNIDLEGNVCLNILREDWKPVLNLNAVVVGLQFLFLEPNASDPLNKEAANDLMTDRDRFRRNVRTSMGGGTVMKESFDRDERSEETGGGKRGMLERLILLAAERHGSYFCFLHSGRGGSSGKGKVLLSAAVVSVWMSYVTKAFPTRSTFPPLPWVLLSFPLRSHGKPNPQTQRRLLDVMVLPSQRLAKARVKWPCATRMMSLGSLSVMCGAWTCLICAMRASMREVTWAAVLFGLVVRAVTPDVPFPVLIEPVRLAQFADRFGFHSFVLTVDQKISHSARLSVVSNPPLLPESSSYVLTARFRGETKTLATLAGSISRPDPYMNFAVLATCSSPCAVSGMSVLPVYWPDMDHSILNFYLFLGGPVYSGEDRMEIVKSVALASKSGRKRCVLDSTAYVVQCLLLYCYCVCYYGFNRSRARCGR